MEDVVLILRRHWYFAMAVLFSLAFLIGPPVLTAFEARYFYPVKFAGFTALPLIFGVLSLKSVPSEKETSGF